MKIEKKTLIEFLRKVQLSGVEQVNELAADFSESGLRISAVTVTKVIRIDAVLVPAAFISYEAIGKIGIQKFADLVKIADKFGKEIDISVSGNLLQISEANKKVEVEIVDLQFIPEVQPLKELQFIESFTLPIAALRNFISDATSVNKEAQIIVNTVEKGVVLKNTGAYKFTSNIAAPEAKGGVTVKFGQPLISAVENLTGDVMFSCKANFPAKIYEKTDKSVVSIIVAPLIDPN